MNLPSLRAMVALSYLKGLMVQRPVISLFGCTLALTIAFVLLVISIPARQPYIVIDAISEMLAYRVCRPGITGVPLFAASMRGDLTNCPLASMSQPNNAITGRLEPYVGTIVTYRYAQGAIAIEINGGSKSAGSLTFANGNICSLPSRVSVTMDTQGRVLRPLPIAGPAEIGREFGSASTMRAQDKQSNDFMYGGSVKVYGYAMLWPFKGALYSSGADFSLPAGGRVTSNDDFNPLTEQSTAAPWFGIAELDEKGFRISATTVSSDLRMYRPGATGEVETFALGLLTRIFFDPSMAIISIFLCAFSFIMSPLATMMRLKK